MAQKHKPSARSVIAMAASSVMIVKCHDADEAICLRTELQPEVWSKENVRHDEEVTVLETTTVHNDNKEAIDFARIRTFEGSEGWIKSKFLHPAFTQMRVKCADVGPRYDEGKVLRAQLEPTLWLQEVVYDGDVVTAIAETTAQGYDGRPEDFVQVRTAKGVEGWIKKMFLQPAVPPAKSILRPSKYSKAARGGA